MTYIDLIVRVRAMSRDGIVVDFMAKPDYVGDFEVERVNFVAKSGVLLNLPHDEVMRVIRSDFSSVHCQIYEEMM